VRKLTAIWLAKAAKVARASAPAKAAKANDTPDPYLTPVSPRLIKLTTSQ